MAAALVLDLRGTTFHAMVLAGFVVALVIIVDDAVVETENITQRLAEARNAGSTESTASVVHSASLETRSLAGYGTVIILVSLIPLFMMNGLSTDSFFPPVASSYALAVLASFLVTLTFTPALTAELFANEERQQRSSPTLRPIAEAFGGVAGTLVRRPLPMLGIGAVVAIVGLVVFPTLDKKVLPNFKDTDLLVSWDASPGTSLPAMARITQLAAKELEAIPGVENVGAHVGRAIMADQVVGIDSSEIWLRMKSGADYGKTVERVRSVVSGYPGLRSDVLTYPQQRMRKVLTGASEPLVVRIFGQELDVLRTKASEVQKILADIDGVTDAKTELQIEEPTLKIEVDLAAAQRFDLRPGDVRRAAATLISGIEVGSLFEDQKVFEVVVRGTPAVRASLTSVRQLLVDTPSGVQVPLDEVADVRIAPTPNVIRHEAVRRSIDVTANVNGRDIGAIKKDLTERLAEIEFPREHHAEVIGDYQDLQNSRRRLLFVTAAALIAVFLLLQVAFSSWRLAFMVSVSSVVGLVGGLVIALIASAQTISFGSAVGFLALLGLTARSGLLIVGRYEHLAVLDPGASVADRVTRGTRDRLGPVVVTAVSCAGAFLAIAVFGNRIGLEIIQPMAIVILGGLVTSTFINLFVLPALYSRFAAPSERIVAQTRPDATPVIA